MPECHAPGPAFDQEPGAQRLCESDDRRRPRQALDLAVPVHDSDPLERVPRRQRERFGTQQHGVQHGLGQCQATPVGPSPLQIQRRRQLLDIERDAVRALVERLDDTGFERLTADRRGKPRSVPARERL